MGQLHTIHTKQKGHTHTHCQSDKKPLTHQSIRGELLSGCSPLFPSPKWMHYHFVYHKKKRGAKEYEYAFTSVFH